MGRTAQPLFEGMIGSLRGTRMPLGETGQATDHWDPATFAGRALERLPVAVAIAVCSGAQREPSLIYGNAAFARLTAAEPSADAPQPLLQCLGAERSAAEGRRATRCLDGGEGFVETLSGCVLSGTKTSLRCQWEPLGLAFGGAPCWTVTLTELEEPGSLPDSEDCLRMVLEYAPLYINFKDREGRYVAASRQWRKLHNLTPRELAGRLPEEISEDKDWARRTNKADREVLENGRLFAQEENLVFNGESRTVLTIKFPRFGADGEIIGLGTLGSDLTERKRAERALLLSEMEAARTKALLSEAVESMTDGFVWYGDDGNLILCNRKYRELFPAVAEDLCPGANYNDLVKLAFDREQFSVLAVEEAKLEEMSRADYIRQQPRFRTKTSEGRWIEARNHPVEAGGFIGIRLDITEQVAAEEALKESELRFKDFAQSGPGGFWEMDENLRIISFFDVQTASGRSRPLAQEAIGRTLWELFAVDVEQHAQWQNCRRELELRRPIKDLRAAYRDAAGRRYFWRINGKPHYDWAGRFSGYRGVAEDETAEVEARLRAEAAEARLIDAIESMSEGFALYDAEDRLVLCNSNYRSICANGGVHVVPGIAFEEIIRINVAHGFVPGLQSEDAVEDWIQRRLAKHRSANSCVTQRWADGRYFMVMERRTREGGIASILSDITALQNARRAAERANDAKTRFLAAASHDLRQPLHAIELFIAALDATVEGEDARELVADLREASEAAGRLLDALLDISELETGKLEGQFQSFPVQRVLDGIQKVYSQQARQKNLSLRVVPSTQIVYSDPVLLERILSNLLSNAVRYTEAGAILIGCRRRGRKLCIEVWDTGPGIPEDERVAVFEEFHQLENPARDRRKGVGLGLSIVQRLANILGHEVHLRSQPGHGSMFAVELALADTTHAAAESRRPVAVAPPPLQGLRVLVIEDDVQVQKAMSAALEPTGCRVSVASDHHQAHALLWDLDAKIDLIVSDYLLPMQVNGVETAISLRHACGRQIPVLIVTADQGEGPRSEIAAQGFKALQKPVSFEELQAALTELIGREDHDSWGSAAE